MGILLRSNRRELTSHAMAPWRRACSVATRMAIQGNWCALLRKGKTSVISSPMRPRASRYLAKRYSAKEVRFRFPNLGPAHGFRPPSTWAIEPYCSVSVFLLFFPPFSCCEIVPQAARNLSIVQMEIGFPAPYIPYILDFHPVSSWMPDKEVIDSPWAKAEG